MSLTLIQVCRSPINIFCMSGNEQSDNPVKEIEEQESSPPAVVNQEFVVPRDKTKLKACTKCGLLKTAEQWTQQMRCQNCGVIDDLRKGLTDSYDNLVSVINPDASWIRKKLRIKIGTPIVSGAYAMTLN